MWSTHACIGLGSVSYAFSGSAREEPAPHDARHATGAAHDHEGRRCADRDERHRVLLEALSDVERVPELRCGLVELSPLRLDC